MPPSRRRAFPFLLLSVAGPVSAQTPAPQPAPTTIPGLEKFSLPGTPSVTPTPEPTPTPTPTATPEPTPSPRAARPPVPTPTPTQTPVATPTPAAPPPVTPPPATTPPVETAPQPEPPALRPADPYPWQTLGWLAAAAVAGSLAWLAFRRARRTPKVLPQPDAPTPPPAAPPPQPRAELALEVRPTRAGLNLLSATVACEVTVLNTGNAPAEGVRLAIRLFSAHAEQEADLAAFRAQPIFRPAAPPFALDPGESRTVRAVVALPHGDIRPLAAAGPPMFVPLVAVNATYRAAEGIDGQTAQGFAVGVERVDSPKLAPFRLDGPPRSTDQVAARAHGTAFTR